MTSSSSHSWRVRRVSCSLILKLKLVPPSLLWSSNVPSSFWSILYCLFWYSISVHPLYVFSHFFWYCSISFTMFCDPVFSLIQSGPKKCMHSLLINIFGINLNEIEISYKFIPKILMSKECIHFFGPLCTLIQIQSDQTNWEECGPCPVFASYTLTFALQLRKKHGETSVMVNLNQDPCYLNTNVPVH